MRNTAVNLGTFLALALVATIAAAGPAPEDVATARSLGQDGVAALEKKDFAAAADLFSRADALYHFPTLTLGLARAHVGLGKLVAAYEAYQRVVREGVPPGTSSAVVVKALEDAKRELPALEARLPSVVITVSGPADASVTLDGIAVPRAALGVKRFVNPGEHTVRASRDGYVSGEAKFTATEGEARAVPLSLEPSRPTPLLYGPTSASQPSPRLDLGNSPPDRGRAPGSSVQRTLGFASLGVGLGALGLGAAMGGVALTDDADLQKRCPDGPCPAEESSRVEGYERVRALAIGSLAAGGALAALGTTLVLTSGDTPTPPQRAIGISLVGVGLSGLALGATTGALSLSVSAVLDGCGKAPCSPSKKGSLLESAASLRTLSFIGLGAGAASLGAGIALWATAARPPGADAAPRSAAGGLRLTPYVGPLGGGVHGAF